MCPRCHDWCDARTVEAVAVVGGRCDEAQGDAADAAAAVPARLVLDCLYYTWCRTLCHVCLSPQVGHAPEPYQRQRGLVLSPYPGLMTLIALMTQIGQVI